MFSSDLVPFPYGCFDLFRHPGLVLFGFDLFFGVSNVSAEKNIFFDHIGRL
jgi:hypothetical protein